MRKKHVVKVFRLNIDKNISNKLDQLVEDGFFVTRAAAIRHAIGLLLQKHSKK